MRSSSLKASGGHAPDDRPYFASRSLELAHHHQFVIVVVLHGLQFPFALGMNGPLGIVAIHDQHVVFCEVVQVAGQEHRECRFSYTALLVADGDACRSSFHKKIYLKNSSVLMFIKAFHRYGNRP